MSAIPPEPIYLGWAAALFTALLALLKWTYRRGLAHRRVAKGLRSYTANAQVLS